jgi:hypothetical protein
MTNFRAVEANLRESFRVLALGRAKADVLELPGVSIASLGVTFQMFNAAFLNGPVSGQKEMDARLDLARAHFRGRQLPWAMWVCEDWLDWGARRALVRCCERHGLRLSAELPGMVAPALTAPRRELPQLEFRQVDCERVLNDFRGIGSVCFHVPSAWFSEVFDSSVESTKSAFRCWVAYQNEKPVATAASLAFCGVLGLYNIATAPEFRGRGFAETLTRHTVDAAVQGMSMPLVLQSTSHGFRLYERMGFRSVTRILVFNSSL